VPRTPYFAPGTLREVLVDGGNGDGPDDDTLKGLLAEVGLERLSSSLARTARWEHELNDDEQRLLGFAALGLQKPGWVVIDEALDTFDSVTTNRVLAMLGKHLPDAAIVNIGRGPHNYEFFPRTLRVVKDVAGKTLKPPRIRAGAIEPPPRLRRRA